MGVSLQPVVENQGYIAQARYLQSLLAVRFVANDSENWLLTDLPRSSFTIKF